MSGAVVTELGDALFPALEQSLWASVREALVAYIPGAGLLLPQDLAGPGLLADFSFIDKAFHDFLVSTFSQGSTLWQAAFLPAVTLVIQGIQTVMPTAQQFINWIASGIAASVGSIDTVAAALTDYVNNVLSKQIINLSPLIQEVFNQISNYLIQSTTNFWSPTLQGVQDILKKLGSFQFDTVANALQQYTNLTKIIFSMSDLYWKPTNYTANNILEIVNIINKTLSEDVLFTVNNIANSLKAFTGFDFSGITSAINQQVGALINQIVDQLKPLPDLINAAITPALDALNQVTGSITTVLNDVYNLSIKSIGELEYYISTEFKFWVGEASEYIISSLSGARQDAGQIISIITGGVTQLENDISALATNDQAYYTDLAARIDNGWVSFADSVVDQISAGIGDLWTGYTNGILGPAAAAIGGFLGGVADRLKEFFTPTGCEIAAIEQWFGGIFKSITDWIMSLCGADCKNKDEDPFNIITRTLTGVIGAGGGMAMSLMLGELISPLKQLGMSRLAAYFWDMADFKAVGGDILKALNHSSTVKPLQYGLNEFFRPELPKTEEANTWLHRGLIQEPEWRKIYARHGLDESYIDKFAESIHTLPGDRMLIAIADVPGVPDDWVDYVLRARGYDELTVQMWKIYSTKRRLADEFSELKSAAEAAFIYGQSTVDDYMNVLKLIGRNNTEIAWALESAARKEQLARMKEVVDIYIQAFRSGQMAQADFENSISALPLVPAKADNIITKELARKRLTDKATRAAKQAKLSLATILKSYDLGLFTDDDAITRLELLNYTLGDAQLELAIHKAEVAGREADSAQKAILDAEKAKVKEEQALSLEWAKLMVASVAHRLVSPDVAKQEITALPLTDSRKALLYKEVDVAVLQAAKAGTPTKPKTLRETEIYKALNMGIITIDEAITYLQALGFTDEEIRIKLAINPPTSP